MDKPQRGTYDYNKDYARKYLQKLDNVTVRIPAGQKEVWHAHAQRAGESLNQYIINAVTARMNDEKKEG